MIYIAVDQGHDRAGYKVVIDYVPAPIPQLNQPDQALAEAWLKEKGIG